MPLRAVSATMTQAVEETIEALDLKSVDAAAVRLAREYAKAIDQAYMDQRRHDGSSAHDYVMRWIAPGLLDVLTALGATPQARGKTKQEANGDARQPSELDKLRQARAARTRR